LKSSNNNELIEQQITSVNEKVQNVKQMYKKSRHENSELKDQILKGNIKYDQVLIQMVNKFLF